MVATVSVFHVYLFLPLWYLYRMGHVMCRVELKLTVPRLHSIHNVNHNSTSPSTYPSAGIHRNYN